MAIRRASTPAGGQGRSGSSGQGLVELALVAPILIVLLIAVFQFAYVFQTQIGVTNGVREAARRAAAASGLTCSWVHDQLVGSGGLLPQNVQGYDATRVTINDLSWSTYQIGTTTNYQIHIKVTYHHPEFFPIAQIAAFAAGKSTSDAWVWDWPTEITMRLEAGDPSATWGTCP